MKFIKVFVNSILSGLFFSSLIALLTYDLNINLDFNISFFMKITFVLFVAYGILITLLCIAVFFIIQFFSGKNFKIAIISPSFFSFSFTILLIIFFLIFRENYRYFNSFFSPEIKSLIRTQMVTLIFLSIIGLLTFYGFHRYKKNIYFFLLYFILFGTAITYSIFQRTHYPKPVTPEKTARLQAKSIDKKVIIIGLEGLSFDFLIPLVDEGKLDNFSWLMEEGSWGKLETFSPNISLILKNSFNTGKFPAKHHQLSKFKFGLLNLKREIEVLPRFIFFRQLARMGLIKERMNPPSIHTKDIWNIFADNNIRYIKRDRPEIKNIVNPTPQAEMLFNQFFKDLKFETDEIVEHLRHAFYSDVECEEKVIQEINQSPPQLTYFSLKGLNVVQSYFYKYSFPDMFGNLDQERITKYGSVIEKYYQFYDQIISKHLASLKEDELLIVFSPHGVDALPLWKRFVEWIIGNRNISAYHDNAPEGVVFFFGKGIVRGKNIEDMKLIDIAPTILNYLRLWVGRDMDGVVRKSMFEENFKMEIPVLYITSYEEHEIRPLK